MTAVADAGALGQRPVEILVASIEIQVCTKDLDGKAWDTLVIVSWVINNVTFFPGP